MSLWRLWTRENRRVKNIAKLGSGSVWTATGLPGGINVS